MRLRESLSSEPNYPNCAMLMQIRDGASNVLSAIKDLEPEKYSSVAAAITPWVLDVEDDDGDVRNAEIATRLHSVHSPAAVDVKIHYRYRPAYYSVEWYFSVSYRIHDRVFGSVLPESARDGVWKPLFTFGIDDLDRSDDPRRWTPRERKCFHMDEFDVEDVQDLLFGEHVHIGLVDTVRLMLACVGIYTVLHVPEEDKEAQSEANEEPGEEEEGDDDGYDSSPEDCDKFDWFQKVTKYNLPDADGAMDSEYFDRDHNVGGPLPTESTILVQG
ncbi:hypothetical protein AURDEDRAFT_125180 [Auricularia subglabra TFB-10046 SS5]|uniref:Uncharacterized protein n=1 Tax=Auricularia subglabra (strain TFB-10046 / SS5) TaxID=717982 RepID=J0WZA6_AURST|nr:hypothetical protein AURDEDRAFT_125180 [Auricularia subglabra TFB-10046 SS5]